MTLHVLSAATHPVAEVARRICVESTPCLSCWAMALEADAEFAAEEGLGVHPVADPDYIDDIAVEIALAGTRRVRLTHAEVHEAVRRLRADRRRITTAEIVERMRLVEVPAPTVTQTVAPVRALSVAA